MGNCGGKTQKVIVKRSQVQITDEEKKRLENITSKENIYQIYEFGQTLGTGGFGTCKIVTFLNQKQNSKKFACKIIPKKKVEKKMHLLLRELEILKSLDHPNIIKFHEIYEDSQNFYIVQELCQGGELLKKITQKNFKFSEKQVAKVMYKIISAVGHMHAKGIVHRDLKPDNILFETKEIDSDIKLIDFGLSNKFQSHERLKTMVGTPLYVSPQVLQGGYTEKCDVWSIGVIMYILLVGYPPFFAHTKDGIFKLIQSGKYDMSGREWRTVSSQAKDLVKKCLVVKESKRISLKDATQHPFFQQLGKNELSKSVLSINSLQDDQKTENILNLLKNYKTKSRFVDEVMKLIVNQMSSKEIQDLTEEFKKLDTDNIGLLTTQEIKDAMLKFDHFKPDPAKGLTNEQHLKDLDEQIEHIFDVLGEYDVERTIDDQNPLDKNERKIQYTKFLSSTLDVQKYLTDEKLYQIFKYFDSNNNDKISVEDLQHIFQRHGRHMEIEEVQNIVNEVNPQNPEEGISWEEFKKIILSEGTIQQNLKVANGVQQNLAK